MFLELSPDRIVRVLMAAVGCFAIAHLGTGMLVLLAGKERLHGMGLLLLLNQFNLDEEMNLPTYFSSFLLACGGGLLLLTARLVRERGEPRSMQWRLLGFCFLAMSFDEYGGVHERIGAMIRAYAHTRPHGLMHFTWLVAGIPFVATAGCVFLPFLLSLRPRLRNALMVAGVVYVGGAVGMEAVGSWYSDRYGEENLGYTLETMVEESMEMCGAILLIRCLLENLAETAGGVRVLCLEREVKAVQPAVHSAPAHAGGAD